MRRLELIPLNLEQLKLYLANDFSLERELLLKPIPRSISAELKDALENFIIPAVETSGEDIFFSTLWTIIDLDENSMIGDLCFYGPPNDNGITELGYGIHEQFRNQGYISEAVKLLIRQAKKRGELHCINASTDKSNPASGAVLKKNGFIVAGESNELIHWKLLIN